MDSILPLMVQSVVDPRVFNLKELQVIARLCDYYQAQTAINTIMCVVCGCDQIKSDLILNT